MKSSQAVDLIGFGAYQLKLMLVCGSLRTANAMQLIVLSFLMPVLKNDWELKSSEIAFISAAQFLGMAAGGTIMGVLGDKFGRRRAYLCVTMWTGICGIATAATQNWVEVALLRLMVGLGVGGASVASVIFMEFCPTHCRAEALVCVEGSFWTFGSLIEVGVAWAVLESTWDWGISRWRALLMAARDPAVFGTQWGSSNSCACASECSSY